MYQISVPIMNETVKRSGREKILCELKRFGTARVILALNTYELDPEKQAQVFSELRDNCRYFKSHGYEVGAWVWTLWVKGNTQFRNLRSIAGEEISEFMCPSDANFRAFACTYMRSIAACGVDLIQFDDDFRYGFLSGSSEPACLCDAHIAEICRITGKQLTQDEIRTKILTGGKNDVRDAYLRANGDAFRQFAADVRKAVDEVNPAIRIGACTCMSSWDVDGTDAYEIAKILAGGTKPFARLIGAPYWAANQTRGNRLQDVIELERMESAWTKQEDIELLAEGDVYPRPRTNCPASYLEGFDTAIRASGCTDGILKYGMDYYGNADYETGYAKFHERNLELYAQIDRHFRNRTSCGVRVYESMKKVSDMRMPTKVNDTVSIQRMFFSAASSMLAYNTIPTVYEGNGVCGIAFDENARHLPDEALEQGLIIDLAAAEILTARGVDVGLREIGTPLKMRSDCSGDSFEHFIREDTYIASGGCIMYEIRIDKAAEVLSDVAVGEAVFPVSYRYENASGQRFLVLNLNTRNSSDNLFRHYARSRQLAEAVEWIGKKKLPAYVYGHPALYMQCKEDADGLAVGLWNFCFDIALDPVIALGDSYTEITFINCSGKLEGNTVYLSDIQPYAFAGIVVS